MAVDEESGDVLIAVEVVRRFIAAAAAVRRPAREADYGDVCDDGCR